MSDSARKFIVSNLWVVLTCLFGGHRIRYYCMALCFGLLLIVALALFNHQSGFKFGLWSLQIPHYTKANVSFSRPTSSGNNFQPVEVKSSYVYSAYLDDRQAPDVDSKALPVVRIFIIMPRASVARAKRSWHCLFWYEAIDKPLVAPVTNITDLDVDDKTRKLMCYMVLCSLPTNSANDPPTAVSLVNDTRKIPKNYLPITDMRKLRKNFEGLTSTTSETWSQSPDISNFTICIPPLRGDYMTRVELIEFIELNRLHGADKFVIFLKAPKAELVSCLQYYSRVGLVELKNWSHPFKFADINLCGQILSQNECLYRMMYRTKFIINQDLDEFITPTRTETWQEMLDLIYRNNKTGKRDRTASYNFRNIFFPLNNGKEPFKVGEYKLKTMTKSICSDKPLPWTVRSKVMARPERLLIWHMHLIMDSSLVRKGDVNGMVDENDGLLFHYRTWVVDRWSTNRRMWRYQKELVASVTSRAKEPECRL